MKKFLVYLTLAVGAIVPGLIIRFGGFHVAPLLSAVIFFAALVGSGFILSWGAETAEKHVSRGLAVAVLALITVLPEYAVDIYFSYQAGVDPNSPYVHYAAANMTGANRLLVGTAWSLVVLLFWWRSGIRGIELRRENYIEIAFLALASFYSFFIVIKERIDLFDTIILVGIFAAYLWRVGQLPVEEAGEEIEVGPAAELEKLPKRRQYIVIAALAVFGAAVILTVAEPFAESLIEASRSLGVNEFLLIQWIAPLASEAPAILIAVLFALNLRPTIALAAMVSDKINQWTLLVGMIPLAFSVGAGALGSLPLDLRQREEFFLTAAQSLFAVSVILCLRLSVKGALALLSLFLVQLGLAFIYQKDEPRTIAVLTYLAWVYLALAAGLFAWNRKCLAECARVGLVSKFEPETIEAAAETVKGKTN